MDRDSEHGDANGIREDEGGLLKPSDHEATQDELIELILDEIGGSRNMAAIACIERGVFSSDDQDAALYKYARFRIDRIVRSRDSDGCPTYVSTNEKAEDGNPRVKRLLYCEQEEFGFAISQKWAQIDAEVRVIHKMEARYEVMFGVAYHREMLPQDE